jgi:hypothetical protein
MHACLHGKTLSPLQVTDSSQRWSYLQRKTFWHQSLSAWLLFSNSDRLYSGSKAPVTCPLYPSMPFHCCTLCKVHISELPSYAALKIPRLSLPCNVQIWQLYFVRGLTHWSDIPCIDPSTPPRIQEWDVLATCRLNVWYFCYPPLQHALRNVVPSRLFGPWSLPCQPSLSRFVWWFPSIGIW